MFKQWKVAGNSIINKTFKEKLIDNLTFYTSAPHTVTNQTPAEIFIGRNRTRIDLVEPHDDDDYDELFLWYGGPTKGV